MYYIGADSRNIKRLKEKPDTRLRVLVVFFILLSSLIIFRLIMLMLVQHKFYVLMSADAHDVFSHLFPKRGEIYLQDSRTKEEYPLAINQDYFLLFADTRFIKDEAVAQEVTAKLTEIFGYDEIKKGEVFLQLNKRTDAYEPLEKKIDEETMKKVKDLKLPGINFTRIPFRYYPEGRLAATVVGFLGKDKDGNDIGHYGIEGYWQKELAGTGGYFSGAKGALGAMIPAAGWSTKPAQNGANILLTIDRNLEYQTCGRLEKARREYGAKSASLILMDPNTGAIRAMCNTPDFDPNNYSQVSSTVYYNNHAVFTAYEPGSVFKTITMAAALNEGVVTPETTFFDSGSRAELCKTPIRNAMGRSYGLQNMSGVLENSINTAIVFVEEKMGKKKFIDYLNNFGFGIKQGIELDTESAGNISTLNLKKGDRVDCYAATASFGQGITVTPLQMATAYSAVVNGGKLLKPYIVDEIRYPDGRVIKTKTKEIRRVISKQASLLTTAMLINVVDEGHAQSAKVKGYYVGGKTGTAQIPIPSGYSEESEHTFVGVAPADDPQFVMLIKFEKPKLLWADSTAAPLFGELSDFVLKYYKIAPNR